MENIEYLYSGNAWLKEHLDGPDGHLWRRARKKFLFDHTLASALNLFNFNYRKIETLSRPEGYVLICKKDTHLDTEEQEDHRRGRAWADDAHDSIRTLLDRIVTRWQPNYLSSSRIKLPNLHGSLTPEPLQYVQTVFDDSDSHVDLYDVEAALIRYQGSLTPLHYHELWHEIARDYKNVDVPLEQRQTTIKVEHFFDKTTLDEEAESALIFGTNKSIYADNYKILSNKLGLFDLVLITVGGKEYFGMVVHVEQTKVKTTDNECSTTTERADNAQHMKFELHLTLSIYVSRECSDLIQEERKREKDYLLMVTKISNITSTRRVISAIHNLQSWPLHRSLLKPTTSDPYFQLPDQYDGSTIEPFGNFNLAQSKAIAIAECMFEDMQERLHLVHGPPGTGKSRTIARIVLRLLGKLGSKKKILLCAPSNNACDELCRRILDEFRYQQISYKNGTLVRVACQPPDDCDLCDHFLDFMVLKDIVEALRTEKYLEENAAHQTEARLLRHAKIVVSTLNYCGSARMNRMKNCTEFIIIDEACQSMEADCLLPLRFNCSKLMLVGDPMQLPPCVLSTAGNMYGLSKSLYARLYDTFNGEDEQGPITLLDIQYRMHPAICQFPSSYFYDERVNTDPSVNRRVKHFPLKPVFFYDLQGEFHQMDADRSSYNDAEARLVQKLCDVLISYLPSGPSPVSSDDEESDDSSSNTDEEEQINLEPIPPTDRRLIEIGQRIAVITPYHAQIRRLRRLLPPHIEIMTVDSAQGQEREIIIISCVRSGGTIGFLDDLNRMNVMLTRARNALYMVGNFTQLASQDDAWKALLSHARSRRIIHHVDHEQSETPEDLFETIRL